MTLQPAANLFNDDDEADDGIPRHKRDKRPKIWPAGVKPGAVGTKHEFYTRASTLGRCLEDGWAIHRARERKIVYGFGRSQGLYDLAQAVATLDDTTALDQIAEDAARMGGDGDAAMSGTALHLLSERADRGEDLSYLSPRQRGGVDAWRRLMGTMEIHGTEQFVVNDELRAAGTYDRLVSPRGLMRATDGTVIGPSERIILDLKGLALDTLLPTPTGWTTMGAVRVGEQVIGSDGHPANVTAKSDVKQIGTYIVEFDTGDRVVCDREHLWWVVSGAQIHREQVIDVETMRDTLMQYGQRQHRVPVAQPLTLPDVELPVDPYLFGCWLGDGTTAGGAITKGEDLFDILEADGHELGLPQRKPSTKCVTRTVLGLRATLRKAGMLGHKSIPDVYLRASHEQRLALLRGLMDTDGTANTKRNRVNFTTVDKALNEQVAELCRTLGLRPQVNTWTAHGYGKTVTAYGVEFRPLGFNPFRLPRKAEKVQYGTGSRARYRVVRSVEPGPDVETACIAVDSPNNTYLCGEGMVPTHNSGKDAANLTAGCKVQQYIYATGTPYTHEEGRGEWPDLIPPRDDWAIVPHIPLDRPDEAQFLWVDLTEAADLAQLALAVRRSHRGKALAPAGLPEGEAVVSAPRLSVVPDEPALSGPVGDVVRALRAATSAEDLDAVWRIGEPVWTPFCTAVAKARLAELGVSV